MTRKSLRPWNTVCLYHIWRWADSIYNTIWIYCDHTLIARFMGPTWGPSGADRTQVGPMLAPWTLLSGYLFKTPHTSTVRVRYVLLVLLCFVLSLLFLLSKTPHTSTVRVRYVLLVLLCFVLSLLFLLSKTPHTSTVRVRYVLLVLLCFVLSLLFLFSWIPKNVMRLRLA